jgi:hypothetical protein
MLFKYEQLWPGHPFHFRVPYQEFAPTLATGKVEYKKSEIGIKATVLTLLDDLDDEEWVYWCIDDKYPIAVDVPRVEEMYRWLARQTEISGILFCRCRSMWDSRCLTGRAIVDDVKETYLERKGYEQIWIHQFLRVKVLRHLFGSFPDVIPSAKSMDELKRQVTKPLTHRIFVSQENNAVFGESAARGIVTRNCHASMVANGLALPPWFSKATVHDVIMGGEIRPA